ncbi:MAG TPA: Gfo/Idh/MocA family oxidoreductase [Clostridiales bacterium]|nr:Gfo/Idh/MocA family oxidoreductase [Clostridiales bacterium]
MSFLKAAVVGCGNISHSHFTALEKNNINIAAVCDIQEERADNAAEKLNCKVFYNIKEMLDWGNFDVVHICTPHYLHADMTIMSLNYGKHVLCEKPMALNSKEADLIEKTIQKHNTLHYGVCFQNRYNESSIIMREIVDSGEMGKILGARGIVCWDRDESYYTADAWRGTKGFEGGGVLINQSIHTLDMLLWLVGEKISNIHSSISTKRLFNTIEVEDTADILIEFESGARGIFFATLANAINAPIELDLYFENGKISLGDKLLIQIKGKEEELFDINHPIGKKSYWGDGHNALIGDFYDSIEHSRKFSINEHEARKTIDILTKVYSN